MNDLIGELHHRVHLGKLYGGEIQQCGYSLKCLDDDFLDYMLLWPKAGLLWSATSSLYNEDSFYQNITANISQQVSWQSFCIMAIIVVLWRSETLKFIANFVESQSW